MARHDRRVGYGLPLVLAVTLHLVILVASVIRLPEREIEPPSTTIVQATLVSAETTTDQAQRTDDARARAAARRAEEDAAARAEEETAAREAEAAEAAEAERQRRAEAEDREEARRAAEEEAARRAEQAEQQAREREAQAERRRQAEAEAERQQQAEAEAERQRQAEAEAERQRQAEAEAERQRQAEAEAERQRQAEAEAERQAQAEAERQRQAEAEAERQRQAAEAASQGLDRAIEGEADNVANARQATEAANSFINLVRRAVEQAWVIPPNVPDTAAAEVSVRLGPSGELFAATIGQSSGNSAFDRSAIQAIESAAPFAELRQLPASVQRDYRQFNLRFRPGDIR